MRFFKLAAMIFFFLVLVFFGRFGLKGWLPIPADTIVGMYYPWKDQLWSGFTGGVPFKNFLITDPVRQLYPWRDLAMEQLKKGELPQWNPYSLAGMPLLANFQSAVFYPLNGLFWVLPFSAAWSILVMFQPFLAGLFMYLFLKEQKLPKLACCLGAIIFAFGGFSMVWLEWGTIMHTGLWLPLILFSIEKIFFSFDKSKFSIFNFQFLRWMLIFVLALTCSFFAGHLQIFFYVFSFSLSYLVWKLVGNKDWLDLTKVFLGLYLAVGILTAGQWRPTLNLIGQSARGIDQASWRVEGWFIPWQNLVQFLASDFFGNPATLNYWGVWNYAEFTGYLGVVPLVLILTAVLSHKKKEEWFFLIMLLVCLSLALPTFWAKIPFLLHIPLIATSQPTRLLFLVSFCGAVLAAFGFEKWEKKRSIKLPFWLLVSLYIGLWLVAGLFNLEVSQRNLILPSGLLMVFGFLLVLPRWRGVSLAVLGLLVFDLFRFGWKFNSFSRSEWLFPSTKVTDFIKNDPEIFRIMSLDRRIFPPNLEVAYRIQSVAGYDPLYLERYGELIAAMERGEPNIEPPFGFNRIITPQNYTSRLADLLNVKYVLSLSDIDSPKLALVFREGETRVYQNKEVMPRVFWVGDYRLARNKKEAIVYLFEPELKLGQTVILEDFEEEKELKNKVDGVGRAVIDRYEANRVEVSVEANKDGWLVLTDSYYPVWRAKVDGRKTSIYRANFNFRAIMVPAGRHQVVFEYGF